MNILKEHEQQAITNSHWGFFGSFMQQTPRAVLSLNRLLNAFNFQTIIELGTHDGGLSTLFALYCYGSSVPAEAEDPREPSLYKNNTHHKSPKNPKQFYTFDNQLRDIGRTNFIKQLGGHFERVDFLNDEKQIERVGEIIQSEGRTLLLCDGGDKIKEFMLYSKYLKAGDFIMAHDWAKDEKAFAKIEKKGIWHGWETKWEDIEPYCEKYGIEPMFSEEFDKSVWFCGKKKSKNRLTFPESVVY